MKHLALILILTSFVSDAIGEILLTQAPADADSICFLTVLKLTDSGYAEEQNLVINDPTEWANVWEKIFANTSAKPPLPEVDFTHRTILAVFQGGRPTDGYKISIEGILETAASLELSVKAFAPGQRCVVAPKVTRPLHIVEIEKTSKPVVFHVKHRTRDCQ